MRRRKDWTSWRSLSVDTPERMHALQNQWMLGGWRRKRLGAPHRVSGAANLG